MTPQTLLSTQNLHKSYGTTLLFNNLSLNLHNGERVGLIGPNGAGKSTLLKIIAGLEEPDTGDIAFRSSLRISYLQQIDVFDEELTIEQVIIDHFPEHLQDWELQKRLNDIQSQMQFENMDQTTGRLSGGWRKRLALACMIAEECELLLLDEPSNHLDLQGILWLESFLKQASFSFVLISHDRFILENSCNRIIDLDRRYKQGYLKTEGNYSQFLQNQEQALTQQRQEETALSNKVRREIDWLRQGPKARTTKAQYRVDKAHDMIDELAELKQRNNLRTEAGLKFEAGDRRSKKLLRAKALSKTRGGRLLFNNLDLFLSPQMKIGIMGANGSGKSSLIKVLSGQLQPDTGNIEVAGGVQILTLDQSRRLVDETVSLKRALSPESDTVVYQGSPLHISAWATKFLFHKDQLELPVTQLSGGERARVLLANIMLEQAEILILDEPTNDLDIPTLEVLESSLQEFKGALILITHDRYLMDRVCDEIIYLPGDGEVKVFADTFQLTRFQTSTKQKPLKTVERTTSRHKLRHEQLKTLRKQFNKTERDIEKAEQAISALDQELQDPRYASDSLKLGELSSTREKLDVELETLLGTWETLGSQIDELETM